MSPHCTQGKHPIVIDTLADFKRHEYLFAAFCDECPRHHQFEINELIANSHGQTLILIIKPCCNEVGKRAQNLLALNARYSIAMRDGDDQVSRFEFTERGPESI